MNTSIAATTAGVTIPTVRTWCRIGAVAAVKTAGRWVIEEASLRYRIALAALKTRRTAPKPAVLCVETMTAIGGSRWTKAGKDRVYLNDWTAFAGLEISRYNTGNISGASYRGEGISNSQAAKIIGSIDKVWFDTADGRLHARFGWTESRVASRQDVLDSIASGVRTAIAAL